MKKIILLIMVFMLWLTIGGVAANTDDETLQTILNNPMPPRDPLDLSVRIGGLDPNTFDIEPRPEYAIGDMVEFFVGGSDSSSQGRRLMQLVAASGDVYMWVEQGMNYDQGNLQQAAELLANDILPTMEARFGAVQYANPDRKIYVFNVDNAGSGIAGLYNDTDRFPNEILPTSNEVTSLIMAVPSSAFTPYMATLSHEFQHLVQAGLDDNEDTWIVEGVAELGSLLTTPDSFTSDFQQLYIDGYTSNQLNAWSDGFSTIPYYGAASLFLTYITQRYGEAWTPFLANEPADGILGIEQALETYGAVDPITGEAVSFDAIFADFVITNYLNDPTVDAGQYVHDLINLDGTALPTATYDTYPVELVNTTVNQYGTLYYRLTANSPRTLIINFEGQDQVSLLPTQPYSGQYFYWSQRGNQSNSRLTGRFDLSAVDQATLSFRTWYQIEDLWDYGYITVSTDDGATWQPIILDSMTDQNPYDRAFGAGVTGTSGDTIERAAPYIGFSFSDGLTIESVVPGTPAITAGVTAGDTLVSINGQSLTLDNFFPIIDQYSPGQDITLTVLRGGDILDLEINLAPHPSRTIVPNGEWVLEEIDLTPFVGGEILVRFDYVTDQATSLPAWLIDDISIPEIGFFDDLESENPVWESEGWVRIDNNIPQNYLVQVIEFGESTTVSRLITPADANSGIFTLEIGGGTEAVLAISGATPLTREPTSFTLRIE